MQGMAEDRRALPPELFGTHFQVWAIKHHGMGVYCIWEERPLDLLTTWQVNSSELCRVGACRTTMGFLC